MENSPKPTILMIPGAWLPSSTYQPLLDVLEKAGFPTVYSRLTSLNPPDPSATSIAADAAAIREKALLPLIENEGKEVVLVMHSYGSLPGGAAAIGLGVKERKRQGKKGGVLGLIPIAAFVIPENTSMADGLGGQFPDWLLRDNPRPGACWFQDPAFYLAHDVEPSLVKADLDKIEPHSLAAFESAAPPLAWNSPDFKGCLAYVVCTDDKAIPREAQDGMIKGSGLEWEVREMHCSHNAPFTPKEKETAEIIMNFIDKFSQV